jgi:hypothetical protein
MSQLYRRIGFLAYTEIAFSNLIYVHDRAKFKGQPGTHYH